VKKEQRRESATPGIKLKKSRFYPRTWKKSQKETNHEAGGLNAVKEKKRVWKGPSKEERRERDDNTESRSYLKARSVSALVGELTRRLHAGVEMKKKSLEEEGKLQ